MKTFKTDNLEWAVHITLASLKRVNEIASVDLRQLSADQLLELDPSEVGKIVWAICKPQADQRGLTADAFADLFGGAEILAARYALAEEAATFFDVVGHTVENSAIVAKIQEIEALAGTMATEAAQELPSAEELLNEKVS